MKWDWGFNFHFADPKTPKSSRNQTPIICFNAKEKVFEYETQDAKEMILT